MLAIHDSSTGFHPRWVDYCQREGIPFKLVDCYRSDIVAQLQGCSALLWHHSQSDPKDVLIAQKLLFACEHAGLAVFPDFKTSWHFDDKVAQKYLLEAIGAPLVPTWVFLNRESALEWVNSTTFPKVFKLRGGAGSANVSLVSNRRGARKLVRRAFGKGFANYDAWGSLEERWRKFRMGKSGVFEVVKGVARLLWPPLFARTLGRESGYVYFQEFVPDLASDYRMIVINDKCLGIRRGVRKNDFRASGSGHLSYAPEIFSSELVETAFSLAEKLGGQSVAMDLVLAGGNIKLIEVSYGFPIKSFADACPGYWDRSLHWHDGPVDPEGWMVDVLIGSIALDEGVH